MSEEQQHVGDHELEAYLDGRMDSDARRRFEQTLPHRADRLHAVRLQQQINRRLQNTFAIPPIPPLLLPNTPASENGSASHSDQPTSQRDGKINGHEKTSPSAKPITRRVTLDWIRWRPPTSFVVTGLLTIGAVFGWTYYGPAKRPVTQQSFDDVYETAAEKQTLIEVKTNDERRFINSFYYRNRQALRLVNVPSTIEIEGLAYEPTLSSGSTVLVAHAQGQPIVVVVDHQRWDRPEQAPAGLHLFRETRGEAVLYEITPFDRPTLLPHLQVTEPIERCRPNSEKSIHQQ